MISFVVVVIDSHIFNHFSTLTNEIDDAYPMGQVVTLCKKCKSTYLRNRNNSQEQQKQQLMCVSVYLIRCLCCVYPIHVMCVFIAIVHLQLHWRCIISIRVFLLLAVASFHSQLLNLLSTNSSSKSIGLKPQNQQNCIWLLGSESSEQAQHTY